MSTSIDLDIVENHSLARRRLSHRFVLQEALTSKRGELMHRAFDVTTHHDKDSRRYVSRVHRVTVTDRVVHWVMDLAEMECPVPVITVATARYSARDLHKIHDIAFAQATEHLDELVEWAHKAEIDH